jgi:hypothetical protein
MSAHVTVAISINSFPPNGGAITDFSMTAAGLPDWLAFDPVAKRFTATMVTPAGNNGRLRTPSPGDGITLTFGANQGFVVSGVPGLSCPGLNLQGADVHPDGTASVSGVVTGSPVAVGRTHAEYSLSLGQPNSNSAWTIDPDFETDVNSNSPADADTTATPAVN